MKWFSNLKVYDSDTQNTTITMTTQTNYDYIQTPKNDEGKYECERCQTEFNDESEVFWAECGDYSKKHGVPLCAECCEDQQENWGECCDSDHDDEDKDELNAAIDASGNALY